MGHQQCSTVEQTDTDRMCSATKSSVDNDFNLNSLMCLPPVKTGMSVSLHGLIVEDQQVTERQHSELTV